MGNPIHSIDLLFCLVLNDTLPPGSPGLGSPQGHGVAFSLRWGWAVDRDEGPRSEHECKKAEDELFQGLQLKVFDHSPAEPDRGNLRAFTVILQCKK